MYRDILRNIRRRPLWWLDGIPRYEPFSPEAFGGFEIALVHTECPCGMRYDVAVETRPPLHHSLRTVIAYTNSLEVGEPPFACQELGAAHCAAGYCMSSLEISVLEFWYRDDVLLPWQRDPRLERPLVDGPNDTNGASPPLKPVFLRIYDSHKENERRAARAQGDYPTMVALLAQFGCERPSEVANMIDLDRRYDLFRQICRR